MASIGISFRGEGRVLALTPATVRDAFFNFIKVNRFRYVEMRAFEMDAPFSGQDLPLLDRLMGSKRDERLRPIKTRSRYKNWYYWRKQPYGRKRPYGWKLRGVTFHPDEVSCWNGR